MKNKYSFFFFFLFVLCYSCQKESILADGIDFTMALGHTVLINEGEIEIKYDELLEDSRFPIQSPLPMPPGRARMSVIFKTDGQSEKVEFSTWDPVKMVHIFDSDDKDYKFEILKVNPNLGSTNVDPNGEKNIEFNLKEYN